MSQTQPEPTRDDNLTTAVAIVIDVFSLLKRADADPAKAAEVIRTGGPALKAKIDAWLARFAPPQDADAEVIAGYRSDLIKTIRQTGWAGSSEYLTAMTTADLRETVGRYVGARIKDQWLDGRCPPIEATVVITNGVPTRIYVSDPAVLVRIIQADTEDDPEERKTVDALIRLAERYLKPDPKF